MYNDTKYSQSESIFDRLPRSDNSESYTGTNYAPAPRTESLFKDLPGSESSSSNAAFYDYRDRTRPTSITVVGVLLVISLALGLIQVMGVLQYVDVLPAWVWLVFLVDYGLLITAIVGLFQMRKYGAWAFLAQSVISTVFSLGLGATGTGLLNLVGSVILLAFVFRKYDEMA